MAVQPLMPLLVLSLMVQLLCLPPCLVGLAFVVLLSMVLLLALMAAALAVVPWCSCPLTIIACPCLPANPRVGASVRLLQTTTAG